MEQTELGVAPGGGVGGKGAHPGPGVIELGVYRFHADDVEQLILHEPTHVASVFPGRIAHNPGEEGRGAAVVFKPLSRVPGQLLSGGITGGISTGYER